MQGRDIPNDRWFTIPVSFRNQILLMPKQYQEYIHGMHTPQEKKEVSGTNKGDPPPRRTKKKERKLKRIEVSGALTGAGRVQQGYYCSFLARSVL